MEYGKNFYQYLTGDESTKGYKVKYMSGPDIIGFGKQFGDFPYNYSWDGPNLSRWDYMKRLIDFVETKMDLSSFFHVYFSKLIARENPEKEKQENFLKDLNKRLLAHGQKIKIKKNKIVLENVKQKTILDDINFNFELNESNEDSDKAIGAGGFADIFNTNDDDVLKKVLRHPHLQTNKVKKRFKEEFRTLKLIANEKFIIPALEYNDDYSYTMKKAEGSFEELRSALGDQEKIIFFYQLGEAIEYIHSKKVFHRDIKAHNCLKLANRWVLSDFGISKDDQSPNLTTTGNAFGTEGYIHPEIIKDPKKWKKYLPKYDYYQYARTIIDNSVTILNESIKSKMLAIGEKILISKTPLELSKLIKEIKTVFTEM